MVKPNRLNRNTKSEIDQLSQLAREAWQQAVRSEAGLRLKEILGADKIERMRSHIELWLQSDVLTEFFGLENETFRIALSKHLQSERIEAVFFIDILGAHAWSNLLFHRYFYEQIATYVKRNFDGVWNLGIVDERIKKKIDERLARYIDVDEVMPDYNCGRTVNLHVARILAWSDEDMKSDMAQELIDLHRVFNIPLFYYPLQNLQMLFMRETVEFHVAVDRNGKVPLDPEGCWVYYERHAPGEEVKRDRVPYSQYEPQLPYHPLQYIHRILEDRECQFAIEKRQILLGQADDKKRVLFVNTPTMDKGGFKGSPTGLLYAIGPLVERIKAKPPKETIKIAGFSQLNIFDPTYYTGNIDDEFEKRLELIDPHIVGISCTSDCVHIANRMMSQVKNRNDKTVTIVGGPHSDEVDFSSERNPNNPLTRRCFDFAIAGDGEYMLPHLIRVIIDAMDNGKTDLAGIKEHVLQNRHSFDAIPGTANLCFNLDGKPSTIPTARAELNLDELPSLRYEYLRNSHLEDFDIFKRGESIMKCVQVMTHRGCRAGCNFCSERIISYPEPIKYKAKKVETIIEELWHYVHKFGVEAVFFDDSTFIEDESFVKELCVQLRNSGLSTRVKWGCLNRFDRVTDAELIQEMASSGMVYMYLGLELFDDEALRRMIKFGNSRMKMTEAIKSALDTLKANEVMVGVSILFGLPTESEEVERRTIEFVGRMVDDEKIHLVSLSLLNYHLSSALTGSSYKQENFNYLQPPTEILARQNMCPWNSFEEGGWFHSPTRGIDEAYLARILWHIQKHIGDKDVLVRQKEFEKFIALSWDSKLVEVPEAYSLISNLNNIALSEYTIVDKGDKYVRYDENLRRDLRNLWKRIQSSLTAGQERQHFLICGPSGAGKTSFVKEIVRVIGAKLLELDLAGMTKQDFESKLANLEGERAPILILVDEIQAKSEERWPYEILKSHLDASKKRGSPVTFVLVGNRETLSDMKNHINSRQMGKDVLRRIPLKNECEIPRMSVGDRIVIAICNIIEAARKKGKGIKQVEKSALFFMSLDPRLDSAGRLSDFASSVAQDIKLEEDILMYDHLFTAGESERRDFWNRYEQYMKDLSGKYVVVSD